MAVEIGPGAVAGLGTLLADRRISSGGHVAVAVGPGYGDEIAAVVEPAIENCDIVRVEEGGTLNSALELADRLRKQFYDAVVGIGGGGTLDVAKHAASLVGLPMVAVATSLSHDGIASPVSGASAASLIAGFAAVEGGNGTCTSIVVPTPARPWMRNSPFSARTRWRIPLMPCESALVSAPAGRPIPSSSKITDTPESVRNNSTLTFFAFAYLTTFVSASCTMR